MVSGVSSNHIRLTATENTQVVQVESRLLAKEANCVQSVEIPLTNKYSDWQNNANSVQKLTSAMIRQPILGHIVRVMVRGILGFAIGTACGTNSEYVKSCPAFVRPKEEEVAIHPLFHTLFKSLMKQYKVTS